MSAACPLRRALLDVLEASVLLAVHDDETLAVYLSRATDTIATEWKRIMAVWMSTRAIPRSN